MIGERARRRPVRDPPSVPTVGAAVPGPVMRDQAHPKPPIEILVRPPCQPAPRCAVQRQHGKPVRIAPHGSYVLAVGATVGAASTRSAEPPLSRCGSHSSQRGRYQFQSPSSFIVAGSSTAHRGREPDESDAGRGQDSHSDRKCAGRLRGSVRTSRNPIGRAFAGGSDQPGCPSRAPSPRREERRGRVTRQPTTVTGFVDAGNDRSSPHRGP